MATDQEFLSATAEVDAAIPDGSTKTLVGADDLCKIIDKIKGPLNIIIPIIELIPIYGKVVAKALRLLLQLASSVCPT